MSLDGVVQAPGGREEDTDGGFTHGGWAVPHIDDEVLARMIGVAARADALLLGRRTYEIFAAAWPLADPGDPIGAALNSMPKHVASRTLTSVEWETAELLGDDVPGAIRALKERDGGELQVHGSAGLIQTLLREDLVDELRLVVFPVLLGEGKRLFGEGAIPRTWRLTSQKTSGTGALMLSYERVGEVETGSVGPEYD